MCEACNDETLRRFPPVAPFRSYVAVRPPEYWPRPLFLALVDAADRFVLADTFQYSRQSYQNRTPVRTPQGSHWLSVPLAGNQHGRPVVDVRIHGRHRWIRKHWRALHYNYRTTPFFAFYEPRLAPLFDREWDRLGQLTCTSVCVLADLFGIDTPIVRASEMPESSQSMSDILRACESDRLLSAEDTVEADRQLADVHGVVSIQDLTYHQNFDGFEPGMSALDLLFNYGPEALAMVRRATYADLTTVRQM